MVPDLQSRFARGFFLAVTVGICVFAAAAKSGGVPVPSQSPHAAKGPQFFLSWNRPWGQPGAEQVRRLACSDTSSVDTLYLCMRPGMFMPSFVAFTADLWFHAASPETLGTYWHFGRGAPNQSGLSIKFQPDDGDDEWVQPWRSRGNGGVGYNRKPEAGQLKMIYAVEPQKAVPLVAGRFYTLARIAVQARRPGLEGCDQGIAIELGRATIATDGQHEYEVTQGGVRHAGSGARAIAALASLWRVDEKSARSRLKRVEPAASWPPAR